MRLSWLLYSWFCVSLLVVVLILIACSGCDSEKLRLRETKPHAVRVRVLAFVAPWCEPCRRAKPFLLSIQAAGVDVRIVDIDKNPSLAKQYGVKSVPTFFVYVGDNRPVRTSDIWVVILLAGCG